MVEPSPRRSRSPWPFRLAVALLLAVLPLAYFYWLGRAEPPAPAPAPQASAPARRPVVLSLGEISGEVEVRLPGGGWRPALPGEQLGRDAAVRTGDSGAVVLVGAGAYEVRLESATEISVEELTDSLSRMLLGTGMATARLAGGARHPFEVRSQGSDAIARAGGGAGVFSVSNNGQGTVAVGTREGEVEFLGAGKRVIVRAGQQSILRPGAGPSEPVSLPTSLLLKVRWPAAHELTTRRLQLVGEAEPGSQVRVGGKRVSVDAKGQFQAPLELSEGQNGVSVQAVGVGGTRAEERRQLQVDTRVDPTNVHPVWE